MKIHNPNDLEFDSESIRELIRSDLDPVRLAVEDHRKQRARTPVTSGSAAGGAQMLQPDVERSRQPSTVAAPSKQREHGASGTSASLRGDATPVRKSRDERIAEHQTLATRYRQLAKILVECEALELVDYEILALKLYPGGQLIAAAKRRRDLWLMACLFLTSLALIGWLGFFAAWVTGMLIGLLVVCLSFVVSPIRAIFYKLPTLRQLNALRKTMEYRALNHVKMLEGGNGLAFQCQRMASVRASLTEKRFQRLVLLSRQGMLIKAMQSVAGIRLYLSYLLEAQNAYLKVKHQYLEVSAKLKSDYLDLNLEFSEAVH